MRELALYSAGEKRLALMEANNETRPEPAAPIEEDAVVEVEAVASIEVAVEKPVVEKNATETKSESDETVEQEQESVEPPPPPPQTKQESTLR